MLKPWYVSVLLLGYTLFNEPSSSPPSDMTKFFDKDLGEYARKQGLEIISLEDAGLQNVYF